VTHEAKLAAGRRKRAVSDTEQRVAKLDAERKRLEDLSAKLREAAWTALQNRSALARSLDESRGELAGQWIVANELEDLGLIRQIQQSAAQQDGGCVGGPSREDERIAGHVETLAVAFHLRRNHAATAVIRAETQHARAGTELDSPRGEGWTNGADLGIALGVHPAWKPIARLAPDAGAAGAGGGAVGQGLGGRGCEARLEGPGQRGLPRAGAARRRAASIPISRVSAAS